MNLSNSPQLADPIQILRAEHEQTRGVCDRVDRLADNLHHGEALKDAALIVEYLTRHLQLLLAHEDEDLFPLLLARCQPEDAADEMIALLRQERRKREQLIDTLLGDLARLGAGRMPERPLDFVCRLMTFTELQRRHTAWVDATVLRLASLRLSAEDRALLAQRIARRRAALDAA
jgi:hemerythrin-like domain-containing protein